MIEMLSIDLTSRCSKGCWFCYNGSSCRGDTVWTPEEVIAFASDCIENGVKAVSLGGGEPLEFDGLFRILEVLNKLAFVSVTSNGLLLDDGDIWTRLIAHAPDKLHISIHFPENKNEISRVIRQIQRLNDTSIIPGVNMIVSADNQDVCRDVYSRLRRVLNPDGIILVPLCKAGKTPTPQMLKYVTGGEPFQSTSCLLGCRRPVGFASVSWDKQVAHCSFTSAKARLEELNHAGLVAALRSAAFIPCQK